MDEHIPAPDSGDLGGGWNDVLVCHIARREAGAVFGTDFEDNTATTDSEASQNAADDES